MTPTKHHEKGLSGRRGGALRGSPDAVISREVSEHLLSSADLGRNKGRSAAAGGRGLRGARGGRGQPERGQAAGTGGGALAREGDALGPNPPGAAGSSGKETRAGAASLSFPERWMLE